NPLVAAKAAATVDQASGGRFIFGVGVGWDEAEFVDLRLPFAERGRLSDDYIRAIKAAFGADIPQYNGKYTSFSGATFSPRPAQRPHPPIWVGGSPGPGSGPAGGRCAGAGRRVAPPRPRARRDREGLRDPPRSGRPQGTARQA